MSDGKAGFAQGVLTGGDIERVLRQTGGVPRDSEEAYMRTMLLLLTAADLLGMIPERDDSLAATRHAIRTLESMVRRIRYLRYDEDDGGGWDGEGAEGSSLH